MLSIWTTLKFCRFGKSLTISGFNECEEEASKTPLLLEEEKMLETIISFFSHNIFYPIKDYSKYLPFRKKTNFRLFQTQKVCRW